MAAGPYQSLADYLRRSELTLTDEVNDGLGGAVPLVGREIRAAVMFADVTSSTERTARLEPAVILAFATHFTTWMYHEALKGSAGIIDKYIGDELMVVFSEEFGSDDPMLDALVAARRMADRDVHSFRPHIGIASGDVIVGVIGAPDLHHVSVFGKPVVQAARCVAEKLDERFNRPYFASVAFPAACVSEEQRGVAFKPDMLPRADGGAVPDESWQRIEPWMSELKGLGETELGAYVRTGFWSGEVAESHAIEAVSVARRSRRRGDAPTY